MNGRWTCSGWEWACDRCEYMCVTHGRIREHDEVCERCLREEQAQRDGTGRRCA